MKCTGVDEDPATGELPTPSLHLRSLDARRRRRGGRPQGQGDVALGVSRARRRRRGAALRSALYQREPWRGRGLSRRAESRRRSRCGGTAKLEPSVAGIAARDAVPVRACQVLLLSILTRRPSTLVFNRTVTLKDAWAKIEAQRWELEPEPLDWIRWLRCVNWGGRNLRTGIRCQACGTRASGRT